MTSHRTDLLSLFAGLLFVAVGVLTLTGGMPSLLEGQWLLPGALIALGIGVLLTVTGSGAAPAEETAADAVHGPAAPDRDIDGRSHVAQREGDEEPPDASR